MTASIRSKPPSKEYKEGYDRVYKKRCFDCKGTGLQDWIDYDGKFSTRPCKCDAGAIYRTIQG